MSTEIQIFYTLASFVLGVGFVYLLYRFIKSL